MPRFETVASVEDIPEGEGRAFEIAGRRIAVFNDRGALRAIDDPGAPGPARRRVAVARHAGRGHRRVRLAWLALQALRRQLGGLLKTQDRRLPGPRCG